MTEKKEKTELKAKEITIPFLKRRTKIAGIPLTKEKTVTGEQLKKESPILLYIDENKNIKVFTNITTGIIEPKDNLGRKKGYENLIESSKQCRLKYDQMDIPVYLHYEKEYLSYPNEPMIDAKIITKGMRILQANYKELEERRGMGSMDMKQVKSILYLVGGLVVIAVAGYFLGNTFGLWDALKPEPEVVKVIVQNITNATLPSNAI